MTKNTKEVENVQDQEVQESIIGQIKVINHSEGHMFGVVFAKEIEDLLTKEENKDCYAVINECVRMLHTSIFKLLERDGRITMPEQPVESVEVVENDK